MNRPELLAILVFVVLLAIGLWTQPQTPTDQMSDCALARDKAIAESESCDWRLRACEGREVPKMEDRG